MTLSSRRGTRVLREHVLDGAFSTLGVVRDILVISYPITLICADIILYRYISKKIYVIYVYLCRQRILGKARVSAELGILRRTNIYIYIYIYGFPYKLCISYIYVRLIYIYIYIYAIYVYEYRPPFTAPSSAGKVAASPAGAWGSCESCVHMDVYEYLNFRRNASAGKAAAPRTAAWGGWKPCGRQVLYVLDLKNIYTIYIYIVV